MESYTSEISQQSSAGNENLQRPRNLPLLPLFLGLILILVLLAVSIVNTMTTKRLENRLKQLEDRLAQLETQVAQIQEEQQAERDALEAEDSEKTSASAWIDSGMRSIAHRGLSAEAPENTLPAFLLASQKGFQYVETDIQFTADGYPVCLHDQWIDRTSNGSGRIDWMTLEQVRAYDFGSWLSAEYAGTKIPTFEEFLKLCRSLQLSPYIELKAETVTPEHVSALVETVKSLQMEDQVSWISFSPALLEAVKECDDTARLGYLVGTLGYNEITGAVLLSSETNRVFLDSSAYSETECRLCEENGIPLESWTINSVDQILALDPYISGVTSDHLIAEDVLATAVNKME